MAMTDLFFTLKNNDALQGKLLSYTDYLHRNKKNSNNNYKYTSFWVQRNMCRRMEILTEIIANFKPSFHVMISISEFWISYQEVFGFINTIEMEIIYVL